MTPAAPTRQMRAALDIQGNLRRFGTAIRREIGRRGAWMDGNDWMAAKLVGLFGLILLALVVVYMFVMFN